MSIHADWCDLILNHGRCNCERGMRSNMSNDAFREALLARAGSVAYLAGVEIDRRQAMVGPLTALEIIRIIDHYIRDDLGLSEGPPPQEDGAR
jgi:hypothetical protein